MSTSFDAFALLPSAAGLNFQAAFDSGGAGAQQMQEPPLLPLGWFILKRRAAPGPRGIFSVARAELANGSALANDGDREKSRAQDRR